MVGRVWVTGVVVVAVLAGCEKKAGKGQYEAVPGEAAVAPSGKYILEAEIVYENGLPYYCFTVLENEPEREVLFACPDRFAARHMTWVLWDKEDRVWVYSGDIGVFYWQCDPVSEEWRKRTYDDIRREKTDYPELLKERRPKYFH